MPRTSAPARTGSTQTRTFGTPSTVIMQFGQRPEQQRRPRGRWYLKLRENDAPARRRRAPSRSCRRRSASTGGPSKVNRDGRDAVDLLARLRAQPHQDRRDAGRSAGSRRSEHLVRARVALRDEPEAAADPVVPPLPLHSGDVVAEVDVVGQLAQRRLRGRSPGHLALVAELVDVARARSAGTRAGTTLSRAPQ